MNKTEVLKNAIFMGISLGGIIIIFGKKYFALAPFIILSFSRGMGKQFYLLMQKDNAGGTTPYNPLKIPAKKISPIH